MNMQDQSSSTFSIPKTKFFKFIKFLKYFILKYFNFKFKLKKNYKIISILLLWDSLECVQSCLLSLRKASSLSSCSCWSIQNQCYHVFPSSKIIFDILLKYLYHRMKLEKKYSKTKTINKKYYTKWSKIYVEVWVIFLWNLSLFLKILLLNLNLKNYKIIPILFPLRLTQMCIVMLARHVIFVLKH